MLITDSSELKRFYTEHRIWQGIPGIVRTSGGRIFVSFYSGDVKETYGNFAVVVKSDDGETFSEPIVAAEKAGKFRCFDPVLWIDPLGRLWFIWNVMPGEEVYASICDDPDAGELVWGEEFYIGRGVMMNKPVVLSSGEWLFPIAVWEFDIYREYRKQLLTANDKEGSFVYKTSDNGKTFIKLGGADIRDRSFDEHMVIELESDVLMMLVRTKYGIGACHSYDRGKTWNKGGDSGLGGPCSRFFISRLKSGRILMVNHKDFNGRNNLTALLSEDDGKTFPHSLLLDERSKVSYPDAMEADDGYIYIVYDRERGGYKSSLEEAYSQAREILYAKITEEDIINNSIVSEKGEMKKIISKLGKLCEKDRDPYSGVIEDDCAFAQMLIDEQYDDVIGEVFMRYSPSCTDVGEYDMQQIDSYINKFKASDSKDIKLLTKIIGLVRKMEASSADEYPVVQTVKQYIEDNIKEDFSIADLAQSLKMSVYYLCHLFKRATGTTVIEYRNEMRLTKAKMFLINTEDPISDIAAKVGFGSSSYFSELFIRSENISPSEYRKYHSK